MTGGSAYTQEVSPGGSAIRRYEDVKPNLNTPEGEALHTEDIQDALTPFLGENFVLHEIVSTAIHLDVLVFRPTPARNHWTFVTSGMSDKPMTVPPDLSVDTYGHAELAIAVPGDWFSTGDNGMMPEAELNDQTRYWPIGLLKFLGRFPHEYSTWFWESHSIPNFDPPEPYASNTKLSGALLAPLSDWPEQYRSIRARDGTLINVFAVIPIHEDEMKAKLDLGYDSVIAALLEEGVTEVVDIDRPSITSKLANRP
jgi:hypothetical protein